MPLVVGWLLLLPILVWVIGVLPAGVLYTVGMGVGFARAERSRRRLGWSLVAGLSLGALVHYTFAVALGIQLYPGLLG